MGIVMELSRAEGSPTPEGTPLPLSANSQESHPEIGGSFGGFIALVVGLAAVFLLSCIGIFLLLRHHEPTPYERHMRRARARQHDFSTEVPIGPPGIRERFARLFGSGKRSGWIKASGGDGDEWDASDDPDVSYGAANAGPAGELRERERGGIEYPASIAGSGAHSYAHAVIAHDASTDPVEVELRAPSSRASPRPSFLLNSETHNGAVLDHAEGESQALPRDSPPSLHFPSALEGSDGSAEYKPRDERTFSIQKVSSTTGSISIRPMRKFENGTKFKEGV